MYVAGYARATSCKIVRAHRNEEAMSAFIFVLAHNENRDSLKIERKM
jgi:hypothetical protein